MSTEFKDGDFKSNELSKCPFTGAGTSAKFSAGRGQTNKDFWPNSLNSVSYTHLTLPTTPYV